MAMNNNLVSLHELFRSRGCNLLPIVITGASLTTTSSANGVTVGADVVDAKDDGSNVITITFKEPLKQKPLIFVQTETADNHILVSAKSTTAFDLTSVQNDANGTGVNDPNLMILVVVVDDSDLR